LRTLYPFVRLTAFGIVATMAAFDAKEVEKRGRDLAKAASTNEPASVLLGLLSELRIGVKASEETLRATKIGIAVHKLIKHKHGAVASAAKELVDKWRTDIKAGGGSKGSPAPSKTSPAGPAAPSPSINGGASRTAEKSGVRPENRNSKTDNVDTNQTGNAIRDACLTLMYDGLVNMTEERKYYPSMDYKCFKLATRKVLCARRKEANGTQPSSIIFCLNSGKSG